MSAELAAAGCGERKAASVRWETRFRLAAVTSHPVQYQAPLFRKLALDPRVDLTVYYGARWGHEYAADAEFGLTLRWDIPLVDGYRARFLPNRGRGQGFFRIVNPAIVRELRRCGYDAVFIHSYAHATALLAYVGAWLSRTPVLLRTESELLKPRPLLVRFFKHLLVRPLLRGTAATLAIGGQNRAFYEHYGVPAERIFSTPYGVDNEFFGAFGAERVRWRAIVREELGLQPMQPIVLFTGKLIARKRVEDLIAAVGKLRESLPEVTLVVVGDGTLRRDLERRAGVDGAEIRFVGFQNQSRIGRYYAAADVLALPSEFETWGLVVNEAMACGLPVVVSGGAAAAGDLVRDGVNGFSYPCGDVEKLCACLLDVLRSPRRCREMGEASRVMVGGWTLDVTVQGILEALESLRERRAVYGRKNAMAA